MTRQRRVNRRRNRRSNGGNTLATPAALRRVTSTIRTQLETSNNTWRGFTSIWLVGQDFKGRSWCPLYYDIIIGPLARIATAGNNGSAVGIQFAMRDFVTGQVVACTRVMPVPIASGRMIRVTPMMPTQRPWSATENTTNPYLYIKVFDETGGEAFGVPITIRTHAQLSEDENIYEAAPL